MEVKHWKIPERVDDTSEAFSVFMYFKSGTMAIVSGAAVNTAQCTALVMAWACGLLTFISHSGRSVLPGVPERLMFVLAD